MAILEIENRTENWGRAATVALSTKGLFMLFLRLWPAVVAVACQTNALHAQEQEESEPTRVLGFTLDAPSEAGWVKGHHRWCDRLEARSYGRGIVASVRCTREGDEYSWKSRLERRYGKPTWEEEDQTHWCHGRVVIDLHRRSDVFHGREYKHVKIEWVSQEAFPLDCSLEKSTESYNEAVALRASNMYRGMMVDMAAETKKMEDKLKELEDKEDF